jgi:hypothetical protein
MTFLRPLLLASSLIALGTAASAGTDAVSVSDCGDMQLGDRGRAYTVCEVRNQSNTPVAMIEAIVILKSPKGAAVTRFQDRFTVPGGIASGRLGGVPFLHARDAHEFIGTPFTTEVQVLRAFDYDGQVLEAATEDLDTADTKVTRSQARLAEMRERRKLQPVVHDATPAKNEDKPAPARSNGKLSADAAERLAREVKACWNPNSRSEIAGIDLVVAFDLDEDAQLVGDVEVVRSTDYDERVVWDAYMAVRRAVLRCQGNGFSVQGPVQDIKMQFVDGASVRVVG